MRAAVATTMKVLSYQMSDVARSRWLLGYTLFFLLLSEGLIRFSQGTVSALLSLVSAVLFVIPVLFVMNDVYEDGLIGRIFLLGISFGSATFLLEIMSGTKQYSYFVEYADTEEERKDDRRYIHAAGVYQYLLLLTSHKTCLYFV